MRGYLYLRGSSGCSVVPERGLEQYEQLQKENARTEKERLEFERMRVEETLGKGGE